MRKKLEPFEELKKAWEEKEVQKSQSKFYVACEGHRLPIFYDGSIIYIGHEPVEIDKAKLGYEALYQFTRALSLNQIKETGV